jgi:hypothetical protein
MSLRHLALAVSAPPRLARPAFADTTVTMLHVSEDKTTQALGPRSPRTTRRASGREGPGQISRRNEAFKAAADHAAGRTSRGQVCFTAGAAA